MLKRVVLFVSFGFLLSSPAFAIARANFVILCVGFPSGDAAFGQIGQEEMMVSLMANRKAAKFIVPVKLKADSTAEVFDEARQKRCQYLVSTKFSLGEFSTWSRPSVRCAGFFDAMYFRVQMTYRVYRIDDSTSIDSGSLVFDGLLHVEDVVSLATDRLSARIVRVVGKQG